MKPLRLWRLSCFLFLYDGARAAPRRLPGRRVVAELFSSECSLRHEFAGMLMHYERWRHVGTTSFDHG